jgi:hypothetical protein
MVMRCGLGARRTEQRLFGFLQRDRRGGLGSLQIWCEDAARAEMSYFDCRLVDYGIVVWVTVGMARWFG